MERGFRSGRQRLGEEVSLGGGIAVTLPDGRVVAMGGVNKDVFLEALRNQAPDYLSHPVEWYRFNGRVMVFDPAAQTWTVAADDEATARAEACSGRDPRRRNTAYRRRAEAAYPHYGRVGHTSLRAASGGSFAPLCRNDNSRIFADPAANAPESAGCRIGSVFSTIRAAEAFFI